MLYHPQTHKHILPVNEPHHNTRNSTGVSHGLVYWDSGDGVIQTAVKGIKRRDTMRVMECSDQTYFPRIPTVYPIVCLAGPCPIYVTQQCRISVRTSLPLDPGSGAGKRNDL